MSAAQRIFSEAIQVRPAPVDISSDTRLVKYSGGAALTKIRNKRRHGERGQSLVEFALILPVFLVLVFGIVDFGLGLKAWITITNSAREGARYAAVSCAATGANQNNVKQKAVDASAGLITTSNVTVTNCPGDSTESVIVKVDYNYGLVTPLGGIMSLMGGGALPNSISMSSTSDMRLE